jgi:hypothetical protein
MRWVEEWTKAQDWGCPCITPRKIQEVQASKLGDAPEAPLLHRQKSGHLSRHYIFIASCTMCFSWSISCFSFQFSLVLFVVINGWTPTNFLCRSCLAFHLPRTLHFYSYCFNECSLFLELRLVFVFALICVQILLYLFIKVYFCLWSLLVFIKRGVYKFFEWCWKREKLYAKKWYRKELV